MHPSVRQSIHMILSYFVLLYSVFMFMSSQLNHAEPMLCSIVACVIVVLIPSYIESNLVLSLSHPLPASVCQGVYLSMCLYILNFHLAACQNTTVLFGASFEVICANP